jgi:hypothetical protein
MASSRNARRALVAIAIAGVVALVGWQLWPSETRLVRRKIDGLAAVVNERPRDGIGQIARTAQLARFFTDDVVVGQDAAPARFGRGGRPRVTRSERESAYPEPVDVSVAIDGERSRRFTDSDALG